MLIEISINSENPESFPIKQSKILIGSSESCDIRISASGISRKHLLITVEDDKYYVTDQGSTNGSYINEERLVPGRLTEFTTFFPVRLGANVSVSLVSEDHSQIWKKASIAKVPVKVKNQKVDSDEVFETKTDLQIIPKAQKKVASSKAPLKHSKKENKRFGMIWSIWFAGAILAGAFYFNVLNRESDLAGDEIENVSEIVPEQVPIPETTRKEEFLVEEKDLTPKEEFNKYVSDIKCATDLEKYLCGVVPGAGNSPIWGVLQIGTTLNVLLDISPYVKEAKEILNQDIVEQQTLFDMTVILLLDKHLPKDLDYSQLENKKINFAFYDNEESRQVQLVLSTTALALKKIQENYNTEFYPANRPAEIIKSLSPYIKVY